VLASAIGPHEVRFVTHYDVSRKMCEEAAEIVAEELSKLTPVKS
jgi:threonine aldolase